MFPALALAFIVVPIVEIGLLLRVGGAIGGVETLALVVVMAVVGATLARRQGFAAMQRVQGAMATGRELGASVVEGLMVLVAAVLMITPGFVTDGVGLLLLVPPVRRLAARAAQAWLLRRMESGNVAVFGPGFDPRGFGPGGSGAPGNGGRDDDPAPPNVIDV